ncbi:hypothetical protein [Microbulbifer sp. DLAB2-AA]|uniref:hypothetical protein n=1 Tax=Microbulbifer sp. DLAB2-AA TaxID=3243394 RepID=UPI004039A7C6
MEDLLNNGWVIGVGGGILSGLFVTWLTRTLFSKKDQKELAINISSANREILYAIRPEISENELPSFEVVDALKNATARKYKIEPERLFSTTQIIEELIKEIMDSSFISSATKKSYCEALNSIIPEATESTPEEIDNEFFVAKVEYKEKMTMLLSMTVGTIAAFATMFSLVKSTFDSSNVFGKVMDSIFPMLLVMAAVVLVMNVMQIALKLRHKRLRAEYGIPSEQSSNK